MVKYCCILDSDIIKLKTITFVVDQLLHFWVKNGKFTLGIALWLLLRFNGFALTVTPIPM